LCKILETGDLAQDPASGCTQQDESLLLLLILVEEMELIGRCKSTILKEIRIRRA
jgi:hypothetical protein